MIVRVLHARTCQRTPFAKRHDAGVAEDIFTNVCKLNIAPSRKSTTDVRKRRLADSARIWQDVHARRHQWPNPGLTHDEVKKALQLFAAR
jgi:hypothetical protein